jgi:hypothetical protein
MSILMRGTLCVIVAGCPANIGVVVEVLARLGREGERSDAYQVRTLSGRPVAQLWANGPSGRYLRNEGNPDECITDAISCVR